MDCFIAKEYVTKLLFNDEKLWRGLKNIQWHFGNVNNKILKLK